MNLQAKRPGSELTSAVGGAGVEAENATLHAIEERLEPGAELGFAFAVGQALESPVDFGYDDGADVEVAFVLAESLFSLSEISSEAGQESKRFTKPRFAGFAMTS